MKKKKITRLEDIPIYDIFIEEDGNEGIRFVSLVKDPAIEIKGMCFSKEQLEEDKKYEFKTVADQQIIVGPAMVPDKLILRKNPLDPEDIWYVRFSKEIIRQMVDTFNRENNNKSINVDHEDRIVDGFIRENWVIQSTTYDKSKFYGFNNLQPGTWFIEIKINDEKFWKDEVKGMGKYGFSIEGYMSQVMEEKFSKLEEKFSKELRQEYYSYVKLYEAFIDIDDIPVHPNCRCEVDNDIWLIMSDACDECRDMQREFNNYTSNGDYEMAMSIFNRHKFGK